MIISVQNQKGGVGKTTLAIHISHALVLKKTKVLKTPKVLLVDADPQGSSPKCDYFTRGVKAEQLSNSITQFQLKLG
jgi:CO dehydrogenase nickel-insertion accessory protein CooC1